MMLDKPLFPPLKHLLLVAFLGAIVGIALAITQNQFDVSQADLGWYLTRARMLFNTPHNLFDEYVYNIAYAIMVGSVDLLLNNLVLSAMLVHVVVISLFFVALYTLGTWLYHRQVALMALALICTHSYFTTYFRQLQTLIPYITLIVWLWIATISLVRAPRYWKAILLGVGLSLLVYLRLDGMMYAVLPALAVGVLLWQKRDWRVIRYGIIAYSVVGLAFGVYVFLFLRNPYPPGGQLTSLDVLRSYPQPLIIFSNELFANLASLLGLWGAGVWLLLAWFSLHKTPQRHAVWAIFALVVFHFFALFALVQMTYGGSIVYYIPLFVYLTLAIAWAIRALALSFNYPLLAWGIVALLIAGNIPANLQNEPLATPFAYTEDAKFVDVQATDAWLDEHHTDGTPIWALCQPMGVFSRYTVHFLYRFGHMYNNPAQPSSPAQLLPMMHDTQGFLVVCGAISYQDWIKVLHEGQTVPNYSLVRVFSTGDVIVYKAEKTTP